MSAVGLEQITASDAQAQTIKPEPVAPKAASYDTNKKITEQRAENSFVARIGMGAGKVVAIFNQAAREAIRP